jgi:putative nucleotidyltransferase with HDIG domain
MKSNLGVRALMRSNLSIPTLPEVVMRVNELIEKPDTGCREIGALVAEDAPLAAKVLRIANSAYYGLANACLSTEHASTVLGVRVLKNIVTQISVIKQFEHLDGVEGFSVTDLWRHSILTGRYAAQIARRARRVSTPAEELYGCGLLHDVGKVVLLDGLGNEYLHVVRTALEQERPLVEVERELLQFDHTDVGAAVTSRWDLPQGIVNAIHLHHAPPDELVEQPTVLLVSTANRLANLVMDGDLDGLSRPLGDWAEELGLELTDVEALVRSVEENATVDI